jgi:hypothetical protein
VKSLLATVATALLFFSLLSSFLIGSVPQDKDADKPQAGPTAPQDKKAKSKKDDNGTERKDDKKEEPKEEKKGGMTADTFSGL